MLFIIGGCSSVTEIKERGDRWPNANPNFCITSWGTIYVPNGKLAEYTGDKISVQNAALLEHEEMHAARQRACLYAFWHMSYATSKEFRWKEEQLGYKVQIEYLRAHGIKPTEDWFIGLVMDDFYGGMVSKEDASKWFRSLPN